MTENTKTMSSDAKKNLRKAGKTLLVLGRNNTDVETSFFTEKNLKGLVSHTTVQTKTHFLLFNDVPNAIKALKTLRHLEDKDYLVKFVHYQVFFTCKQLEGVKVSEKLEHGELKNQFRKFLGEKTNAQLLYPPRIYRKGEEYMGCGYLTLDTKDAVDALLSEDKLKTSKLENGYELTFYRYRKNERMEEGQDNEAVNA